MPCRPTMSRRSGSPGPDMRSRCRRRSSPRRVAGSSARPRRRAASRSRCVDDAVHDLAQVVRRDVGRHADRDARRAVHEQVGNGAGDRRLLGGFVVVRDEVDGLLVEVRHHALGERLQPRLGVAHRRGRIAVDRAEVPLAVDQRIAHVEVLRHAHQRVVDRRRRRAGGSCPSPRRRSSRTCGRPRVAARPIAVIAYSTRRCAGFRPSRTSGSARPMMTLMA